MKKIYLVSEEYIQNGFFKSIPVCALLDKDVAYETVSDRNKYDSGFNYSLKEIEYYDELDRRSETI